MSLNELQKIKGSQELLELAMIPSQDDRLKAIDGWLRRRVRDYHVDFTITKEAEAHLQGDYESYLEHQKKTAAYKIGEALLKDKMILCTHMAPDEDEFSMSRDAFKWWDLENRYRCDCYVYFGLY